MELKKSGKINFLEKAVIFLVVLFKYLIVYGISNVFLYLYLAVLIVIVFLDLYIKKMYVTELKKLVIFSLLSCFFILFYFEHNFLISVILAIICLKRNDREFIKTFFCSSVICFVFTLFMNIFEVLESYDMIRNISGITIKRYSLGFSHPNEVFLFFLPIVLSGFYLFYNKKLFYIVTFAFSLILYQYTNSRTGFGIIIIFLIFVIFRKLFSKKIIKKIIPILFVILTLLSIVLAVLFGKTKDNRVSELLSGRPFYWNYYIENETLITPFGNNKVDGQFLDNFYIYLLVQLGIVGYMIYYIIYYISLKRINYDYRYLIISTLFLIYGLFESNVIIGSIQFLFAIQIKSIIEEGYNKKTLT